MELPERQVAQGWVGMMILDREGDEIGTCVSVFADDATELPEWVTVELNGTTVFVPVVGASESDGRVRVTVTKADVSGAPAVGDSRSVSQDEEAALYRHYGIEYSRSESETVLPADAEGSDAAETVV
ncbi:MAG: hypothetical protein QOC80_1277, partial [Frankiaceae bacterium]|nr:hypothetical protein [Frankiaceae bacterium]